MSLDNHEGRSEMNQIKIGKFIAERRKERGFLQKDIAARLGISEKTVSKWECGQGYPEITNLIQISNLFHVTDLETQIERCLAEDRNITGQGSMYISAML